MCDTKSLSLVPSDEAQASHHGGLGSNVDKSMWDY